MSDIDEINIRDESVHNSNEGSQENIDIIDYNMPQTIHPDIQDHIMREIAENDEEEKAAA